jgi:transcriptional regulator with XRE-family HTH domain
VTPAELKRIREALGMTQASLAESLGVTKSAVSRWEAGLRGIPEPAARLAERLLQERKTTKRKR